MDTSKNLAPSVVELCAHRCTQFRNDERHTTADKAFESVPWKRLAGTTRHPVTWPWILFNIFLNYFTRLTSCAYIHRPVSPNAYRLESLRVALIEDGYSDVTYFVVNMKGVGSSHLLSNLVSFPVYQDTASLDIWSLLDGRKDDILIYDRWD